MRKMYLLILSVFVAIAFSVSTASAYSIYAVPSEITVAPCPSAEFTIDLFIDGIGDDHGGLFGWTMDVEWDPLLELMDVTWDDTVWDKKETMDPLAGNPAYAIGLKALKFAGATGETIKLADFHFHCIGCGETDIIPMEHFGLEGPDFVMVDNYVIDSELTFSGVHVNQVPIPGTLLLLGSGLLGMVGIGRKKMMA